MFRVGITATAIGSKPVGFGKPAVASSAPATTADKITSDSIGSNTYNSGDWVADGSTVLVLLMQQLEEVNFNLTRALQEGDITHQMMVVKQVQMLGKALVTLRKL